MQMASADLIIPKARMPTDGVPQQLLTLLVELLRSHELPALAMGGAWCKVWQCLNGRPALGPVCLELGLFDLGAEYLASFGQSGGCDQYLAWEGRPSIWCDGHRG